MDTLHCTVHSDIEATAYCTTDKVLCCAKCCLDHKKHKTITIDEFKKEQKIHSTSHVKQGIIRYYEKKQEEQTEASMKGGKPENKEEIKNETNIFSMVQPSVSKEQAIENLHKLYQPDPKFGKILKQKNYSKSVS